KIRGTFAGTSGNADLVLPDHERGAELHPDVLDLLGHKPDGAARPVVLVTVIGEQLEPSLTLAEQQVRHGTILRLVDVDAAPPPPDVADVTAVVGDLTAARADAWQREWGLAVAAVLAAMLGVAAAFFGAWADETAHALAPGVLAALAVVTARRRQSATAVVLTGAAAGLALAPAGALTARY